MAVELWAFGAAALDDFKFVFVVWSIPRGLGGSANLHHVYTSAFVLRLNAQTHQARAFNPRA